MPERLEAHGEVEHVGHVLGRPREDVRRQDVDQRLVLVEPRLVGVGDLGRRLRFEARGDQHPVLAAVEPLVAQVPDVGDVLHVQHRDAVVEQRPPDEVGQQVAAQVADVRPAVDGRPAGVHPDGPVVGTRHRLDAPGERVAQERPLIAGALVERRSPGHRTAVTRRGPGDAGRRAAKISLRHAITKRARRVPWQRPRRQHRSPGGVARRGLISCPAERGLRGDRGPRYRTRRDCVAA